jgi:hypothetical protein
MCTRPARPRRNGTPRAGKFGDLFGRKLMLRPAVVS